MQYMYNSIFDSNEDTVAEMFAQRHSRNKYIRVQPRLQSWGPVPWSGNYYPSTEKIGQSTQCGAVS